MASAAVAYYCRRHGLYKGSERVGECPHCGRRGWRVYPPYEPPGAGDGRPADPEPKAS